MPNCARSVSSNAAAGLTHGFPVSSSGSRTALGDAVGSRTQLYSLVTLLSVLAVMLFARGVLARFPMAALGALVVYAALRLIDVPGFKRLAAFAAANSFWRLPPRGRAGYRRAVRGAGRGRLVDPRTASARRACA